MSAIINWIRGPSLEDHLFTLRFTAKQLSRESARSEKLAKENKTKCKKAMEQSNMEGARIYAENAIREKNTAMNYLRLSSRIDAASQRVNTAIKMKTLTKSMGGVVGNLADVMKSMNVEKITKVMDEFEKQFENLDIASSTMESSLVSSSSQTMPETEIESLMQEVADENGLEFQSDLLSVPSKKRKEQKEEVSEEEEKQSQKKEVLVGGQKDNKDNKPKDDNNDKGSGGELSSSASVSSASSSGSDLDRQLEERLRRLQGL